MTDEESVFATWLPVIGKSLANLCLTKAVEKEPTKFDELLKRVKFLEGLGLSRSHAAEAAGSSAASVGVLQSRSKRKKANNGKAKKKTRR